MKKNFGLGSTTNSYLTLCPEHGGKHGFCAACLEYQNQLSRALEYLFYERG